jgi:hypothetical protein
VEALGIGPLKLSISVEKGKETETIEYIQVLNSEPNPIHVIVSVSGDISQFLTIEPSEFDLPAGPGLLSNEPRPTQNVKLTFRVPREVPKNKYTGEVVFHQQPVGGGVIGAGVMLSTHVDLTIGRIAKAEFPIYIIVLAVVLIVLMISSLIVIKLVRRYSE